jgi:hypothetical protein
MLAYDEGRLRALMFRLFRASVCEAAAGGASIEARAGIIGDEDAETAVRREAVEEIAGVRGAFYYVARVWSCPRVSTERQSLILAAYNPSDRNEADGGAPGRARGSRSGRE